MSSWLLRSNFALQVLLSSKHLCFVYEILSWLELPIPASSLVISTSVSLFPWVLLQQNWLLNWIWDGTVLNLGLYLEHFCKFQMKQCSSNRLQVMKVYENNLSFFLFISFLQIHGCHNSQTVDRTPQYCELLWENVVICRNRNKKVNGVASSLGAPINWA